MVEPTPEQEKIISENSNCVIIARPGSGKTFVLSEKIKSIVPTLLDYQGVIAISYTNKASNELKKRCLKDGLEKKNSFFSTIDTFLISEIIRPFGIHIFKKPEKEIQVIKINDLDNGIERFLTWYKKEIHYTSLKEEHFESLKEVFIKGYIILDLVGILALCIFQSKVNHPFQ